MKKHKPVKHAHRKAMTAEKKAKGKFSRCHLPKPETCLNMRLRIPCWASCRSNCLKPWCHTDYYKSKYSA